MRSPEINVMIQTQFDGNGLELAEMRFSFLGSVQPCTAHLTLVVIDFEFFHHVAPKRAHQPRELKIIASLKPAIVVPKKDICLYVPN